VACRRAPGRAKRNIADAGPQAQELADPGALFSTSADNKPSVAKKFN
jgi:hypothetical protein